MTKMAIVGRLLFQPYLMAAGCSWHLGGNCSELNVALKLLGNGKMETWYLSFYGFLNLMIIPYKDKKPLKKNFANTFIFLSKTEYCAGVGKMSVNFLRLGGWRRFFSLDYLLAVNVFYYLDEVDDSVFYPFFRIFKSLKESGNWKL